MCILLICIWGRTNNLAHPALSGLIIDFFYTGSSSVGQPFPEVFGEEVLRVTVAIAATAVFLVSLLMITLTEHFKLKVGLDKMASSQGEVNFRVGTYTLVYLEMLGLMNKCDTSEIHAKKTKLLQCEWAMIGR